MADLPHDCAPIHGRLLIIDLVDPSANGLVAEGTATSRMNNDEITGQHVDDVVTQIMASIWAN